tara:strand:- start:105 stop:275 length:171 start_codon:yes stop_codon:yes gene_type:complete
MIVYNEKTKELYHVKAMKKVDKTLQEKAEYISRVRTEIAGEVNTDWTPIKEKKNDK